MENRSLHQEQGRSPVESSHSRRSNRLDEVRTPRNELPTKAFKGSKRRKQMVRHSIRAQNQIQEEEHLEPLMHERVHATLRLGPVLTEIPITEEPPRVPAKKPLGRPPNKKKAMPLSLPERASNIPRTRNDERASSLQHSPGNLEEEDGFSESIPSSTLKILSWNCRGLENPAALNYDHIEVGPPYARGGGGLALLWKKEIEVNILYKCDHFIDTEVRYKGEKFYATFVYGDPEKDGRAEIWRAIKERSENREAPWFLTREFNEILDNSEKKGGPARAEGSFVDFQSFMSGCDLFDLRFSGNFLSWRGKRRNHLVRCRLDRAMANSYWIEAYPYGRK
ncbi:unnamed protein product [Microthlaspi erraticum]|uniref:Endonuclease/exonuclease/phosphatase domain-containing protein n=1 Tax=Microthlaspi erraticum TaxID=1685480 RepID=A0A6D2L579_9BRAS|nr:unnamed protein product [Microthlaspi erraticum]